MKNFVKAITVVLVSLCGASAFCATYIDQVAVHGKTVRYMKKSGDSHVELLLEKNHSSGWNGEYSQGDEPVDDYCGPTAMMNILHWYDNPIDKKKKAAYKQLGREAKTNKWAKKFEFFPECEAACLALGLPPIGAAEGCAATCNGILKKRAARGTLPKYMKSALSKHKPKGYKVYMSQDKLAWEQLMLALSEGNPVATLISTKNNMLHWVTVVGHFKKGKKWFFRLANATQPTVDKDTFRSWWSLKKVSSKKSVRNVLKDLGLRPYSMVYFAKKEKSAGWKWDYKFEKKGSCTVHYCGETLKKNHKKTVSKEYMFGYAVDKEDKCLCKYKDVSKQPATHVWKVN